MGLSFYRERIQKKADKLNHPMPFPDYLIINGKIELSVLDCGCGPFTTLGTEGFNIKLTACDLFAKQYNEMLKDQGIIPIVPIEYQNAEEMDYSDESFDVVHCRNALDHMSIPRKAIEEMIRVCKIGGLVYFEHYKNLGLKHEYRSSHKWNIDLRGEDCSIWNRNIDYKFSNIYPGFSHEAKGRMIVSKLVR